MQHDEGGRKNADGWVECSYRPCNELLSLYITQEPAEDTL